MNEFHDEKTKEALKFALKFEIRDLHSGSIYLTRDGFGRET